jgi:hypothetical protein
VVNGKCSVNCANTSLPWFIGRSGEVLARRMAELLFGVQIETRKNHELLTPLQSLTSVQWLNVRTPLGQSPFTAASEVLARGELRPLEARHAVDHAGVAPVGVLLDPTADFIAAQLPS